MADASSNVRPVTLQLIDAQGHILQEFFFAQEKIVIGRITSADLKIEDPTVSRVHALIEVHPDRISITDLASTHGTFLEGQKVLNGEIRPGQDFQIGKIKVHVKEGALDKVPVEFRESYRQATATPAFGTNLSDFTPTSVPVHEPKKPKKPTTETKRTTTPVPAPKPHAEPHAAPKKEKSVETPRPQRQERSNFTQEIVREHSHVMGGGQCLSIVVYWHESVLDDSVFRVPSVVRIGESSKNDYMIPMGSIEPADSYDFVTLDEGGATLFLNEKMRGRLRLEGKMIDLENAKQTAELKGSANGLKVRIGRKDFAKITVGQLTFFLMFVPEPPVIPPLPFFEPDATVRRIATIILLLMIGLAVILGIFVDGDIKPKNIEQVPERFRPIIVDPTKPRVFVRAVRTERGGNEGEGQKAEGTEGKRGMQDAQKKEGLTNIPKTDTQQKSASKDQQKAPTPSAKKAAATARKVISDKQVAQQTGVLAALSGALGKQLGKAGGPQSGSDPLQGLMLGLSGPGATEGSGIGSGTGLKGTSGGGGGSAVGIGGLGTKGSGLGRTGFGRGGIPGKGEADVSTIAENIQVLGSLDKSIIDAIIRRHLSEIRYCYEAEIQRFPDLKGKVVIGFTIAGTGQVSESHVVSTTIGNSSVDNCVKTVIRRLVFPAPQGGGIVVVKAYPFLFNRR